jgi:SAM-dependent methyltransferase
MTASDGHLRALRLAELRVALSLMPGPTTLLEIGGADGTQARALADAGFQVRSLDIAPAARPVFPVERYDGVHLPVADGAFAIVFSSNVLEHVVRPRALHAEIRRVLAKDGVAVHVVPSTTWRMATTALHGVGACVTARRLWRQGSRARAALRLLGNLVPRRHGEAGTHLSELWRFSRAAWIRHLEDSGFDVEGVCDSGVFYSGFSVLDAMLPMEKRAALAHGLGGACHVLRARPRVADNHLDPVT